MCLWSLDHLDDDLDHDDDDGVDVINHHHQNVSDVHIPFPYASGNSTSIPIFAFLAPLFASPSERFERDIVKAAEAVSTRGAVSDCAAPGRFARSRRFVVATAQSQRQNIAQLR